MMRKKNTFKRPLALLLSLVLIFSMLPIQALAEEYVEWVGEPFADADADDAGDLENGGIVLPFDNFGVDIATPAALELVLAEPFAAADTWDGNTATDFTLNDSGNRNGSQASPYLIESAENLAYLRDKVNDGTSTYANTYFKLSTDIDLDDKVWVPIGGYNGSAADTTKYFAGIFDGGDFCISGLKIDSAAYQYAGLFGYVSGASIGNLGVRGSVTRTYSGSGNAYTGGLVGYQTGGEIKDCYAIGNITASMTGSGSQGSYLYNYAGGLVGYQTGGSIINTCYTTGNTSASTSGTYTIAYAGGLVGYQTGGEIKTCYTTGNTSATASTSSTNTSAYAGGLVGYQQTNGEIKACYTTGNTSAEVGTSATNMSAYVGGLVGSSSTISGAVRIIACYAAGNVTAAGSYTYAGGVTGSYPASSNGTITGCFWNKTSAQTVKGNQQNPKRGTSSLDCDNTLGLTAEQTQDNDVLSHLNALSAAAGVTWEKGDNGGWPIAKIGIEEEDERYGWIIGVFSGGNGIENNPYLISSWEQLCAFSGSVNNGNNYAGKYIQLTEDIVLTDIDFVPIGLASSNGGFQFNGSFDGNNKTIKDLTINSVNLYCGLFGYIGSNGTVSGVNIVDGKVISSSTSASPCTGLLAGCSVGEILYCNVQGEVTGSTVTNYNGGTGGLVGRFESSQIIGCGVRGTVDGTSTSQTNVGGLVGYTYNGGVVKSSYVSVVITAASSARAGGLIGNRSASTYIEGGYWNKGCTQDVDGDREEEARLGVGYGDAANITAKTETQIKTGAFTDEMNEALNVADHVWSINLTKNDGFPYISPRSVLGGSLTISGTHAVGQTLAADISMLTPSTGTGTISYQWTRNSLNIEDASARTYTITAADAGCIINVKVTAQYYGGSVSSANTDAVPDDKNAGPAVDGAPTLASKTYNGITVNAVNISTNPENTTVEYAIATSNTVMPTSWQSGTTFTNLNASTTYYVYARAKESTSYYAGTAKVSAAITTDSNAATVSFNANGGSGMMSNATALKGSYNMPLCSYSYANHSFAGWKIGNSGTTYLAGETINLDGNITLYAQWISLLIPSLGKVTGATLSVTGQATWTNLTSEAGLVNYNVQLYKDDTPIGFAKTSAAASGGTGVSFLSEMRAAGVGSYTVVVTAIGNGTSYNSGTASDASSTQAVAKLPAPTNLAWSGHNAAFNRLSNETVVNKYSIAITGSGSVASTDVAKTGSNLSVTVTSPANGDMFKVKAIALATGLYLDSDEVTSAAYGANNTAPTINGQTSGTDTINLTEGYSAYTKAYYIDGTPAPVVGVSGITDSVFTSGELTVPAGLTSVNSPYTVIITATNVKGSAAMTVTVNITASANPTISFDANSGNGTMANEWVPNGSYNLPLCQFTRDNYTFSGWKIGNSGTTYLPGATVNVSGNITLYAQWTALLIPSLNKVTGATLSATGQATWTNLSDQTGLANYSIQLYKGVSLVGSAKASGAGTGGTGLGFLTEMRAAGVGSYTVVVTAIGNGTTHSNGAASDVSSAQTVAKLSAPSGLAWIGDSATWNKLLDETNAEKYNITITGSGMVGSANVAKSGSNLSVAVTSPANGDTFRVKAIAPTTGLYLDSDEVTSAAYVTVQGNTTPTINTQTSGTDTINLTDGYLAYSKSYSIAGTPAPSASVNVGNTAGASISGNTLTIPTGLTAASSPYAVTITATNVEGSATMTVTVNVAPTYTVTVNAGTGGSASGGGSYAAETVVTISATPNSNYNFSGWSSNNGGIFGNASSASTTFTVPASNTTITASFTYTGESNGNGGSGSGSSGGSGGGSSSGSGSGGGGSDSDSSAPSADINPTASAPTSASSADPSLVTSTQMSDPYVDDIGVFVDGNKTEAGTVTTEGSTTTVTVDQNTFNKEIETDKGNVTVVIPSETGTAVAELVVKNVDDMAAKEMTLTIQVGNVQYEIPAAAVDTSSVLAALGADNANSVSVSIVITTELSTAAQAAVQNAVQLGGGTLVVLPMEFNLTATYEGKTVEISTFSEYVSRTIEVTADQAKMISTAVIVETDGTTRHVPTYVYQENGNWYATINSLTNSIYALVYNEVSFTDTQSKWYESAVNEMGSRGIISGIGDNQFAGERDITRAEFAAIIIRALGLPSNGNGTVFNDVSASAWYASAVGKAYEYGIVSGVGNGEFAPQRKITRQEAMLMIQRAAKIAGFTGSTGSLGVFSDAESVIDWAIEAVRWNVGSGLVVVSDDPLRPRDNITRAETAALVLKLLQKAGLIDERMPLSAQATKTEEPMSSNPRKEPDPIQIPDDNDDDNPDPDGGNDDLDRGDNDIVLDTTNASIVNYWTLDEIQEEQLAIDNAVSELLVKYAPATRMDNYPG